MAAVEAAGGDPRGEGSEADADTPLALRALGAPMQLHLAEAACLEAGCLATTSSSVGGAPHGTASVSRPVLVVGLAGVGEDAEARAVRVVDIDSGAVVGAGGGGGGASRDSAFCYTCHYVPAARQVLVVRLDQMRLLPVSASNAINVGRIFDRTPNRDSDGNVVVQLPLKLAHCFHSVLTDRAATLEVGVVTRMVEAELIDVVKRSIAAAAVRRSAPATTDVTTAATHAFGPVGRAWDDIVIFEARGSLLREVVDGLLPNLPGPNSAEPLLFTAVASVAEQLPGGLSSLGELDMRSEFRRAQSFIEVLNAGTADDIEGSAGNDEYVDLSAVPASDGGPASSDRRSGSRRGGGGRGRGSRRGGSGRGGKGGGSASTPTQRGDRQPADQSRRADASIASRRADSMLRDEVAFDLAAAGFFADNPTWATNFVSGTGMSMSQAWTADPWRGCADGAGDRSIAGSVALATSLLRINQPVDSPSGDPFDVVAVCPCEHTPVLATSTRGGRFAVWTTGRAEPLARVCEFSLRGVGGEVAVDVGSDVAVPSVAEEALPAVSAFPIAEATVVDAMVLPVDLSSPYLESPGVNDEELTTAAVASDDEVSLRSATTELPEASPTERKEVEEVAADRFTKGETWLQWATNGLSVNMTGGVYAGATGRIVEIMRPLESQTLYLYVHGLGVAHEVTLSEISRMEPSEGDACRIVSEGPHKGRRLKVVKVTTSKRTETKALLQDEESGAKFRAPLSWLCKVEAEIDGGEASSAVDAASLAPDVARPSTVAASIASRVHIVVLLSAGDAGAEQLLLAEVCLGQPDSGAPSISRAVRIPASVATSRLTLQRKYARILLGTEVAGVGVQLFGAQLDVHSGGLPPEFDVVRFPTDFPARITHIKCCPVRDDEGVDHEAVVCVMANADACLLEPRSLAASKEAPIGLGESSDTIVDVGFLATSAYGAGDSGLLCAASRSGKLHFAGIGTTAGDTPPEVDWESASELEACAAALCPSLLPVRASAHVSHGDSWSCVDERVQHGRSADGDGCSVVVTDIEEPTARPVQAPGGGGGGAASGGALCNSVALEIDLAHPSLVSHLHVCGAMVPRVHTGAREPACTLDGTGGHIVAQLHESPKDAAALEIWACPTFDPPRDVSAFPPRESVLLLASSQPAVAGTPYSVQLAYIDDEWSAGDRLRLRAVAGGTAATDARTQPILSADCSITLSEQLLSKDLPPGQFCLEYLREGRVRGSTPLQVVSAAVVASASHVRSETMPYLPLFSTHGGIVRDSAVDIAVLVRVDGRVFALATCPTVDGSSRTFATRPPTGDAAAVSKSGQWMHVVASLSNKTLGLVIDGREYGVSAILSSMRGGLSGSGRSQSVALGAFGQHTFRGLLRDARLWDGLFGAMHAMSAMYSSTPKVKDTIAGKSARVLASWTLSSDTTSLDRGSTAMVVGTGVSWDEVAVPVRDFGASVSVDVQAVPVAAAPGAAVFPGVTSLVPGCLAGGHARPRAGRASQAPTPTPARDVTEMSDEEMMAHALALSMAGPEAGDASTSESLVAGSSSISHADGRNDVAETSAVHELPAITSSSSTTSSQWLLSDTQIGDVPVTSFDVRVPLPLRLCRRLIVRVTLRSSVEVASLRCITAGLFGAAAMNGVPARSLTTLASRLARWRSPGSRRRLWAFLSELDRCASHEARVAGLRLLDTLTVLDRDMLMSSLRETGAAADYAGVKWSDFLRLNVVQIQSSSASRIAVSLAAHALESEGQDSKIGTDITDSAFQSFALAVSDAQSRGGLDAAATLVRLAAAGSMGPALLALQQQITELAHAAHPAAIRGEAVRDAVYHSLLRTYFGRYENILDEDFDAFRSQYISLFGHTHSSSREVALAATSGNARVSGTLSTESAARKTDEGAAEVAEGALNVLFKQVSPDLDGNYAVVDLGRPCLVRGIDVKAATKGSLGHDAHGLVVVDGFLEAPVLSVGPNSMRDRCLAARWDDDPEAHTTDCVIEEDGMYVRNSGSASYALLNIGFSGRGKFAWEMLLDKDSDNDECTCFGIATRPVSNPHYASTENMWLIRSYNGQKYHGGAKYGASQKIRTGSTVRFVLNLDEASLQYAVDDGEMEEAFTGIDTEGLLYPCVQMYSGKRGVRLIKVEALGAPASVVPPSSGRVGWRAEHEAEARTVAKLVLTSDQASHHAVYGVDTGAMCNATRAVADVVPLDSGAVGMRGEATRTSDFWAVPRVGSGGLPASATALRLARDMISASAADPITADTRGFPTAKRIGPEGNGVICRFLRVRASLSFVTDAAFRKSTGEERPRGSPTRLTLAVRVVPFGIVDYIDRRDARLLKSRATSAYFRARDAMQLARSRLRSALDTFSAAATASTDVPLSSSGLVETPGHQLAQEVDDVREAFNVLKHQAAPDFAAARERMCFLQRTLGGAGASESKTASDDFGELDDLVLHEQGFARSRQNRASELVTILIVHLLEAAAKHRSDNGAGVLPATSPGPGVQPLVRFSRTEVEQVFSSFCVHAPVSLYHRDLSLHLVGYALQQCLAPGSADALVEAEPVTAAWLRSHFAVPQVTQFRGLRFAEADAFDALKVVCSVEVGASVQMAAKVIRSLLQMLADGYADGNVALLGRTLLMLKFCMEAPTTAQALAIDEFCLTEGIECVFNVARGALVPLHRSLFLIAVSVVQQMLQLVEGEEAADVVVGHLHFGGFLNHVSNSPEPFVSDAVARLMSVLCRTDAHCVKVRDMMIVALDSAPLQPTFPLEVLFGTLVGAHSDSPAGLSESMVASLFTFLCNSEVLSPRLARAWQLSLRLLRQFAPLDALCTHSSLCVVLQRIWRADSSVVQLLQHDTLAMLKKILSTGDEHARSLVLDALVSSLRGSVSYMSHQQTVTSKDVLAPLQLRHQAFQCLRESIVGSGGSAAGVSASNVVAVIQFVTGQLVRVSWLLAQERSFLHELVLFVVTVLQHPTDADGSGTECALELRDAVVLKLTTREGGSEVARDLLNWLAAFVDPPSDSTNSYQKVTSGQAETLRPPIQDLSASDDDSAGDADYVDAELAALFGPSSVSTAPVGPSSAPHAATLDTAGGKPVALGASTLQRGRVSSGAVNLVRDLLALFMVLGKDGRGAHILIDFCMDVLQAPPNAYDSDGSPLATPPNLRLIAALALALLRDGDEARHLALSLAPRLAKRALSAGHITAPSSLASVNAEINRSLGRLSFHPRDAEISEDVVDIATLCSPSDERLLQLLQPSSKEEHSDSGVDKTGFRARNTGKRFGHAALGFWSKAGAGADGTRGGKRRRTEGDIGGHLTGGDSHALAAPSTFGSFAAHSLQPGVASGSGGPGFLTGLPGSTPHGASSSGVTFADFPGFGGIADVSDDVDLASASDIAGSAWNPAAGIGKGLLSAWDDPASLVAGSSLEVMQSPYFDPQTSYKTPSPGGAGVGAAMSPSPGVTDALVSPAAASGAMGSPGIHTVPELQAHGATGPSARSGSVNIGLGGQSCFCFNLSIPSAVVLREVELTFSADDEHFVPSTIVVEAGTATDRLSPAGYGSVSGGRTNGRQVAVVSVKLATPAACAAVRLTVHTPGAGPSAILGIVDLKLKALTLAAPGRSLAALRGDDVHTFSAALDTFLIVNFAYPGIASELASKQGDFATLAQALLYHLGESKTGRTAHAIIAVIAGHEGRLAEKLLLRIVDPLRGISLPFAYLAADICAVGRGGDMTVTTTGRSRLRILWDYVAGRLSTGEVPPTLTPYMHALSFAVSATSSDAYGHGNGAGAGAAVDLKSVLGISPVTLVPMLVRAARAASPRSVAETASLELLCTLLRIDVELRDSVGKTVLPELAPLGTETSIVDVVTHSRGSTDASVLSSLRAFGVLCAAHPQLPAMACMKSIILTLGKVAKDLLALSFTDRGMGSGGCAGFCGVIRALVDASADPTVQKWVGTEGLLHHLLNIMSRDGTAAGAAEKIPTAAHAPVLDLIHACVNLCPNNQRAVAESVLTLVESVPRLNTFLTKVLVRAAVMEETVTVCVEHPLGAAFHPCNLGNNISSGIMSTAAQALQGLREACSAAVFDADISTPQSRVSEDGLRASAVGGAGDCTVVNVGFRGGGRYAWTFKLLKDQLHGQCTCFGAAILPVTNGMYQSSREVWMLRSFNGHLYCRGRALSSGTAPAPIRPNDTVRFELDLDAGTLSYSINGAEPTVAFTDMNAEEFEIHPAVCFYSSNREIGLESVEVLEVPSNPAIQRYWAARATAASVSSANGLGSRGDAVAGLPAPPRCTKASQLRFHRCGPLYTLPSSTTVGELMNRFGAHPPQCKWRRILPCNHPCMLPAGPGPSDLPSVRDVTMDKCLAEVSTEGMPDGAGASIIDLAFSVDWVTCVGRASSAGRVGVLQSTPPHNDCDSPPHGSLLSGSDTTVAARLSTAAKAPVFRWIAKNNGLPKLVNLVRKNINLDETVAAQALADSAADPLAFAGLGGSAPKRPASTAAASHRVSKSDTDSTQEMPGSEKSLWWRFLRDLESYLAMPGYAEAFIVDEDCMALLLHAIGVRRTGDSEVPVASADALRDPCGALLGPLEHMLRDDSSNAAAVRKTAVVGGALSCLLVGLGEVQGAEARNFDFVAAYEDPLVRAERERLKAAKATARAASEAAEHEHSEAGGRGRRGGRRADYWAKGTGYGHGSSGRGADEKAAAAFKEKEAIRLVRTTQLLRVVEAFLDPPRCLGLPEGTFKHLEASSLVPVLESFLRSSELDICQQSALHLTVYRIIRNCARHEELVPLLERLPDQHQSLQELLEQAGQAASEFLDMELVGDAAKSLRNKSAVLALGGAGGAPVVPELAGDSEASSPATPPTLPTSPPALERSTSGTDGTERVVMQVLADINTEVQRAIKKVVEKREAAARALASSASSPVDGGSSESKDTDDAAVDLHRLYIETLKPMLFDKRVMADSAGNYHNHYSARIAADGSKVSSATIKRVMRELRGLKKSLPIGFESSIFLRYDKSKPFVIQVLITGPHDTPYDSGAFLFDVYCSPEYPRSSPNVNLATTGGGSVRFNPNLYNCGKVCLSLLGTWRGGGRSEEWTEKSTMLQVLVSIQALILVKYPYYNEPGVESQIGTPEGERGQRTSSNGGYEYLRVATIQWAMVDQLRNPPAGFEEVIRQHFRLKRRHILEVSDQWLAEATVSDTAGHATSLRRQVEALRVELAKLGESPCDLVARDSAAGGAGGSGSGTTVPPDPFRGRDISAELATMSTVLGDGYPPALLKKALELNEVDPQKAIDWVVTQGETYLGEHLELFKDS